MEESVTRLDVVFGLPRSRSVKEFGAILSRLNLAFTSGLCRRPFPFCNS